jgi:hypothetical protein
MTDWKEATLEELENEGYRVGEQIAQANSPDPVDNMREADKEIFKENLMEELTEAEENYRTYSPFEFFTKDLNEREDSDDAWEAYDEGISRAFSDTVDEYDDKPIPITKELGEELTIQMLDEYYPVNIAGQEFNAGHILKQLDETYFHQVMNDHMESMNLEIV